jgi:hypothetical protein
MAVMKRHSRTARQLMRQSASSGARELPAQQLADARARDLGFMPRLSWRCGARVPTDWASWIDALAAEHELAVFCDNSAFDDHAPPELWDVLLSEPGRMVLTQRVNFELRPWLGKRPDHPVTKAALNHHPGLSEWREPELGEPGRRVFDYYMALLSLRRATLEAARRVFRREHGRDPDTIENRRLADEVQRHFGERGRLLAGKAAGNQTDEALVWLAVQHALTTGRQTLILTRDADVEEQFFTLLWLIDTHYRGMLLADRYVDRFGSYRTYPMPDAVLNDPDGPFEPHDAVIIERDLDLRDVLPPEPHAVGISCLNAGVYCSHLSFMAETEMARLLATKDATGGLSTDRLGGRNIHASINPVGTGLGHDCAAIVHDKREPIGTDGATVAVLDMAQAMMPGEQHARLVPGTVSSMLWTPPANRPWV